MAAYHAHMGETEHMMGNIARNDRSFGRVRAPRLRLGIPARLVTLDGTLPVMLEDLSGEGAKITLPVPLDFAVGVLRWMDHHGFADVRWRDGLSVGLAFATPLDASLMDETRRYARDLVARLKSSASEVRAC